MARGVVALPATPLFDKGRPAFTLPRVPCRGLSGLFRRARATKERVIILLDPARSTGPALQVPAGDDFRPSP